MVKSVEVTEQVVFQFIHESVKELVGTSPDAEYTGENIQIVVDTLTTKPDNFPLWGVLMDMRYIHWVAFDRDVYLFQNGTVLERRYSGKYNLMPAERVSRELFHMLQTVSKELDLLAPVQKFARTLHEAHVQTQPQFIQWLMENEKGR